MMEKKILIHTDEYPLVILEAEAELGEEDIEIFSKDLKEVLRSHEGNFIIVTDQSKDIFISGKSRIKLGRALSSISNEFKQREKAVFVVVKSVIGRTMMNCLQLLAGSNSSLKAVSSVEEAKTLAIGIIPELKIEA